MNLSALLPTPEFLTVTEYRYPDGFVCDFSRIPRPHYCMGLILAGSGEFTCGEEVVTVTPGEVIFVPVRSEYISHWHGGGGVHYISFHFSFDGGELFPPDRRYRLQKAVPAADLTAVYTDALSAFTADCSEARLSLLADLYRALGAVMPNLVYDVGNGVSASVRRATEYLRAHYREKISVPDLAALCHISPSYFYARFRRETGKSPLAYKMEICLQKACLLLVAGEAGVEQISASLGFESSTYFRRMFRRYTGMSPRRYVAASREGQGGERRV